MKRTVLTFGSIAGAVSAGIMLRTMHYVNYVNSMDFRKGDILGYTSIVLSALLVFFGIRSYRADVAGDLTFGREFAVGVAITLLSSLCYMSTFQIIYFKLMPGIGEKHAACMVERARASGKDPKQVEEVARTAQRFKQMYDRPAINAALTFAEAFPVGFVVSGISACSSQKEVKEGRRP